MSKQLSAHQFKQVFEDLGYDLSKLGCIMLDTEPLKIEIPPKKQYFAKDKARFWIDGVVCDKTPHVTLLYGLLRNGHELKKHVDAVLEGWKIKDVEIADVSYFDSPYEDEEYYCIVAHLVISSDIIDGNSRLKFLPHIDTFPGFKAHITLAYIKKDEDYRNRIISQLDSELEGKRLKVLNLNYGDRP